MRHLLFCLYMSVARQLCKADFWTKRIVCALDTRPNGTRCKPFHTVWIQLATTVNQFKASRALQQRYTPLSLTFDNPSCAHFLSALFSPEANRQAVAKPKPEANTQTLRRRKTRRAVCELSANLEQFSFLDSYLSFETMSENYDKVEWLERRDEIQQEIRDLKLRLAFYFKENLVQTYTDVGHGLIKCELCEKYDTKSAFMLHYEHCPMFQFGPQQCCTPDINRLAKQIAEMQKDVAEIKNKI